MILGAFVLERIQIQASLEDTVRDQSDAEITATREVLS